MSRIKSEGLSVSVVIGMERIKVLANVQSDNLPACDSSSGERRLLACSRRQLADDIFERAVLLPERAFRQAAEKNRLTACAPQSFAFPTPLPQVQNHSMLKRWNKSKVLIAIPSQILKIGPPSAATSTRPFASAFSVILLHIRSRLKCKMRPWARAGS